MTTPRPRPTTRTGRARGVLAVSGALVLGLGALAVALPSPATAQEREVAETTLRLAGGRDVGKVVFFGVNDTVTRVKVALDLPSGQPMAGFHGFHVHANDDPSNGSGCVADPAQPPATWFVSADGHLAEPGQTHGAHRGDLPPLLVTEKGRAYSVSITDRMHVDDVVGRAVLLNAGADNLGNVPVGDGPLQYTPNTPAALEETAAKGNAGDRVACGVVSRR